MEFIVLEIYGNMCEKTLLSFCDVLKFFQLLPAGFGSRCGSNNKIISINHFIDNKEKNKAKMLVAFMNLVFIDLLKKL